MVAVVSGNGLGLFSSSLTQLGLAGGGPSIGGSRTDQYVNLATGNLILTGWDESLFGHGFATGQVRTYNSQGSFAQTGADGWQTGYERTVRLAFGAVNTAGSQVERATADGSVVIYAWNATRNAYLSTAGDGAHDTIVLSGTGSSAKWLWTEGSTQVQETYDASSQGTAGRLEKIADLATGATYALAYDGALLSSITGANGEMLTFGYDGSGRLSSLGTSERDATGTLVLKSQVGYGYDAAGRLAWVQTDLTPENAADNAWDANVQANNDGKSYRVTYTYADSTSLRITGVATSDGITVAYAYDASGRITSVTQGATADGSAQSLTYAYSSGATTVTDGAGRSWTYQYDAAGQLTAVLEPAVAGQRAITEYSYDADGNVVRIRQAAYAGAASTLDTVYQYDANGNVILQRDLLGNTVVRTYSSANRVLTEARYTVPDADGLDPTHAGTVNVPGNALVTRYVYDTANPRQLRFVIDAAGDVSETQYNASGVAQGLVSMTRRFVGASYDTSGLAVSDVPTLSAMTTWISGKQAQTTRVDFGYDAQGRLAQRVEYASVDSSGVGVLDDATSIRRYTYDAQGLLRQQVTVRGAARTLAGAVPGGSEVVDFVYDGMGRLLSTIQRSSETAANDDTDTITTTVAYVDSQGRIVTTFDSGMVRTEVYDAAGLLLSLSEAGTVGGSPVTRTTQSIYDATGRLRAVQDATGGTTYFFYDAAGRLSATVDATGAVTRTLYDAIGRVSGTTTYATRVATAGWYSAGAVTKDTLVYAATSPGLGSGQAWVQTDAANDRTATRTYDAAGRLASEIDAAGLVTAYAYDGAGRLLSATQSRPGDATATPHVTRYFHDDADRLVATLDADGFLVEMIYDAGGRLVQTKRYANATNSAYRENGTLAQLRPVANTASDQIARFLYDGRGNQVGTVDAEGYFTEFVYDEKNNQRAVKQYAKKLTGLNGSESLATLRSKAMSGAPAEPFRLTQSSFNGLGQLVTELDAEGTVTRYSYDESGRLVRTEAAQSTSEVRENHLRYDVFGQLIGEMSGEQAAAAIAALGMSLDDPALSEAQRDGAYAQYGIRHSYDLLGRRTESIDASGAKTFYFYDAAGRQTFVVRGVKDGNGIANAQGEVTETRYTAFGQISDQLAYTGRINIAVAGSRASVQAAIGTLSFIAAVDSRRQYAYDQRGLLTRATDAEGMQTARSYTAFGQLYEETTAYGTALASTTRYAYTLRGLLNQRVDAYGTAVARTTSQTFDAFGRVATVTDANGSITAFTYDRLGRQVGLSRTVSGQTEAVSTAYDAFGRVLSQTDARGNVTSYAWSDTARSLTVTTPEGVAITTVHNRFGQTVSVSQALPGEGTATTTTTYDRNGAVVSVVDPLGNSVGNTYDVRGLLTETTDASGRKVHYSYDAAGRVLTRVEDPGAGKLNLTTTYAYDGQGRQLDVTDASGRVTRMSYDREGRLTQVAQDPDGLNLRTVTAYDAAGRVLTVTEGYGTSAATTVQYSYDALNRRTVETVDPGTGKLNLTTHYAYDANDNLVTRTDALGNVTRYAYDEAGRLRFVVDATGAVTETVYDRNGNAILTRGYAKALGAAALSGLGSAPSVAAVQSAVTSQSLKNDAVDQLAYRVLDRDNRVRFVLDATGTLTETRYDSAGRTRQTLTYGTPFATASVMTKLRAGTATVSDFSSFVAANEAAARASQFVYDAAGRVVYAIARSDAGAVVSEYRYDASGLRTAEVAYATTIAWVTGQTAAQVASALTAAGGNAADQQRLTCYAYDDAGRLRFSVDDAGAVTERRYDGAGRVTATFAYATPVNVASMTEAAVAAAVAGQANARHTGYAYDAAGRLISTTDALNQTESYGYDAAGRRTSFTNKLGAVWTYDYDAAGRMTAEHSPAVSVARYDASGNIVVSTASIVTRRSYDALGQVLTVTENADTAEARTTTYEYDARGRQIRTIFPDAGQLNASDQLVATGVHPDVRVSYDALDRAVVQKNVLGNYSYKVYDSQGRLVYDIDEAGYVTAYAYDAYDEQTQLTRYANKIDFSKLSGWSAGKAITLAQMAATGVLVANGDDRTLTTSYDRLGRKTAITQPAVAYYKANGTLSTGAPTTRFKYDNYGNLVQERQLLEGTPDQSDAVWADTFHYYDDLGQRIRSVDAEGYVTAWQYDALGQVELQIEFARRIDTATLIPGTPPALPAAGDAATGYDRSTLWQYDLLGRKVAESTPRLYQTAAGTDDVRVVDTLFGYDAEGRLLSTTVDGVLVDGIAYDALGRTVSTTEAQRKVLRSDWQSQLVADANLDLSSAALYVDAAPFTTMEYDAFGNALRVVRYAAGKPATGAANAADPANAVTTVRYDWQGRAVATRDATGTVWHTGYDAADHVVDTWYTLSTAASGDATVHTTASYDALGRQLTSVSTRTPVGGGAAVTDAQSAVEYNAFGEIVAKGATPAALASAATSAHYAYDKAGRIVGSNAETGTDRSYFYDLAGHQVREERPWTDGTTAATAVYLTLNDRLGRVTGQILPSWNDDPAATAQVSVILDRWGNVLRQTDPRGNVSSYAYNDRDQMIRQTAPGVRVIDDTGGESWQTPETRWMYDALGRLVATRDANGHVRTYGYDAAGQQVSATDATGAVTRVGRDALGREVAAEDALGYLTYVDYDKLDHAVAQGDFLIGSGGARTRTVLQTYLLNQNGDRLQVTDATGVWTKYDYDSRSLLLRSQTRAGVVRTSAYDAQGRKISETDGLNHSNLWSYDYLGRLTDHVDLGGAEYSYSYDARSGLLTAVTGTQSQGMQGFGGGGNGTNGTVNPTAQQNPGDDDFPDPIDLTEQWVDRHTEYYANGQVKRITDAPIYYYFEYDAAGNRTLEETKTVDGSGKLVHTITRTSYDAQNRITRVTTQDIADGGRYILDLSYAYDAVGNRRRVIANSAYGSNSSPLDVGNHAPEVTIPIPDQTTAVNQPWSYTVAPGTFADFDGDALAWSASGMPAWMHFDAATQTFSGTPGGTGSWTMTVTVQDPSGATASAAFTLTADTAGNQPPVVANPIPNQGATAGQAWSYTVPAGTFSDPEGQTLTYSASGMPAWMSFSPGSRTFSGTSPEAGSWTLTVTAQDPAGASVSTNFSVTAGSAIDNEPPVVANPIPDQSATVGQAWAYAFPANTFSDPEGQALTYTAGGMPPWMSFNATTRKFSGTPSAAGSWTVAVTAQDPSGASVNLTFEVTASVAVNQPPVVANPIPDQSATVGQPWIYKVPVNTFSDPDGQALTLTVSGMPSWMSFTQPRRFTGIPPEAGSWTLTVTAQDPSGGTVSDVFVVTATAPSGGGGNAAPYQNLPLEDQYETLNYTFPADTFVDPDGDMLTYTYSVTPLGGQASIHFDAATRTFTGSPGGGLLGKTYTITVTASDDHGHSASGQFQLFVSGTLQHGMGGGLYDAFGAGIEQVALDQQAQRPPGDIDPGDDDPPGGGTPPPLAPNTQALWFSYDAENRVQVVNGALVDGQIVVSGKRANSDVESYALHYDAAGRAVNRTTLSSTGAVQVAQSTYTERGELSLEYAMVDVGADTGVVARHEYDAAGREVSLTEYFKPGTTRTYRVYGDDDGEGIRAGDDPGHMVSVDVSGWRSHQTQTTYDLDGRVSQVGELGRSDTTWYRYGVVDPALTALSNVYYSGATGASGYDAAGRLTTYRYQNLQGNYTHTYETQYLARDGYLEQSVTGSSSDPNYKTTTTTGTYDKLGRRVTLTQSTPISGQSPLTSVRYFSFDAAGGILTRRDGTLNGSTFTETAQSGQHYTYVNGQQVAALGEDGKIDAASQLTAFDSSQVGVEPALVLEGDTLQTIAQRVYGNSSLWYAIAAANAVTDATLVAGTTLKVPSIKTTANDASTFKPYDPNAIQGPTTPGLPYITPPPKQHCNALATILMAVVAIVVTVYTAGVASFAMSGLTSAATTGQVVAAAAIGAAAGSVASQAVGSLMGVTSFSWRGVAASAITGAITAGIGSLGSIGDAIKAGSVAGWGKAAGLALANAGANYAGQKLAGMDVSFSWASIAASAVSSVASAKIAPLAVEKFNLQSSFAKDFAYGVSGGLVSGAVRSSFGQTLNGSDYLTIVADAFGNALANTVTHRTTPQGLNAGTPPGEVAQTFPLGPDGELIRGEPLPELARGGVVTPSSVSEAVIPPSGRPHTSAVNSEPKNSYVVGTYVDGAKVMSPVVVMSDPAQNDWYMALWDWANHYNMAPPPVTTRRSALVQYWSNGNQVLGPAYRAYLKNAYQGHTVSLTDGRRYMTDAEIRDFQRQDTLAFLKFVTMAGPGAALMLAGAELSPIIGGVVSAYGAYSGGKEVADGHYIKGGIEIGLSVLGMGLAANQIRVARTMGEMAWMPSAVRSAEELRASGQLQSFRGAQPSRIEVSNRNLGLVELDPRLIRTTQTTIKQQGETLPALVESMKKNGFVVEPDRLIDVVRMPDGQLTSLDTTRILAADRAGINVQARLWEHTDLLPDDVQFVSRFIGRKGEVPVTFGDAVMNRIGRQNGAYPKLYPYGSPYAGTKY